MKLSRILHETKSAVVAHNGSSVAPSDTDIDMSGDEETITKGGDVGPSDENDENIDIKVEQQENGSE